MAGLKSLAGQTAVYGVSSIIGRFLNYLLVPLYTRAFKVEEYGIVTELYAYVVVLQIFLTYGMETGYFRFSTKYENDSETVFSTILISILTTTSLFLFFILLNLTKISTILGYSEHPSYIFMFTIILSCDTISAIFFARLRKLNKALKFASLKLLNIITNIFFNIFFIVLLPYFEEKGIHTFSFFYSENFGVGYIFISNLIASLLVFLFFIKDFFKIRFRFNLSLWKKVMIYSLPLLITGLAGVINEMADRILIKFLVIPPPGTLNKVEFALYQLGLYGANAKLAVLMMLFVQAFRYAAEPFFFSKGKKITNETLHLFADVMKYYVFFGMIMFLFILLNIDIFKHIIGSAYYKGLNVVLPLFLSRFLVGIFFILSFWYKLTDLTKYGIVIFSIGAIITLAFDFLFIPKFGYIAAAWVNFSTYFVMVCISYFWSRKYLKVPYDFKRIFLYLFTALFIYFFSNFMSFENSLFKLIINNILIFLYLFLFLQTEKIKLNNLNLKKIIHEGKNSK